MDDTHYEHFVEPAYMLYTSLHYPYFGGKMVREITKRFSLGWFQGVV